MLIAGFMTSPRPERSDIEPGFASGLELVDLRLKRDGHLLQLRARLHGRLLKESRSLIASCPCRDGCPSCVGPAGEVGDRGKEVALALLDAMLG